VSLPPETRDPDDPPRSRSRLRRAIQPIEGDADRFSTERSFSPPIGSRTGTPERPRGYHIDLSVKASQPSWPPPWLQDPERQLHVATVQWALGAWERHLAGEGEGWRRAALDAAEHLLAIQQPDGVHRGAWLHWFPMPHTYVIEPPWASAITQGEAASLMVRLFVDTGDERYAESARLALAPLATPTRGGGLLAEADGLTFFEEYPTRPASLVLNGAIFTLWGVRDVALGLGDPGARELYEAGLDGLVSLLPRYDTGYWSRYDLYPHLIPNVASGAYHLLHVNQLTILAGMEDRPEISRTRDRFEAYRGSGLKRRRALAAKAAFRLASPRNARLARALPWAARWGQRSATRDLVVLCYHGVADRWDPGLSVSPDQLERQLTSMLERGYRPATFSDAVLGDRRERTFAVTFDDAYESVGRLAAPLMARLGVPGTIFVPTAFPGDGRPMSWPGIDHIAAGPTARELVPMGWEEMRRLADSGWEIGSHTHGHPRLTELADDALARELRDSRADCESRLDRPCTSVAYPYGDQDRRVLRAAARAGYGAGGALPPPYDPGSPLAFPRIGVYGGDGAGRFRLKTSRPMRAVRRGPLGGLLTRASRNAPGQSAS
jgi:peptidoglycan/xylan/chitin deacetylase (PgdA/CDA1 family)